MLNRRHLRIKVLQILYAYFQSHDKDINRSEKELMRSIEKMYEMYVYYLLVFEELTRIAEERTENRQNRMIKTDGEQNPHQNFVENKIFKSLALNLDLKKNSEQLKVNWTDAVKNDLMRKLFNEISQSEAYQEYSETQNPGFEDDKAFAVEIFKQDIANFALIHDFLENESIYWMDDIDLVCSMVLKTIKSISEGGDEKMKILPLYKDVEDEKTFVELLFRITAMNDEANDKIIDSLTKNWELDRIARMDIILLKMAITELLEFETIPKKVTLNEYIEISKFYSTPKSQVFINGILDKAIEMFEKEGKLVKSGRGLIN